MSYINQWFMQHETSTQNFPLFLFPSGEAVGIKGSSVHEAQAGWPLVPTESLCKQHEQTHGQKKCKSGIQGKLSENFANLTGDLAAAADTGDTSQCSARLWS